MQKYLLLLVCLIGTMNARAGITVVPPTLSESGAYELTFNSGDEGYASMSALPEYVKNATSLKIITINGYKLSHDEMAALMGNSSNSLFKDHLQRLDMGDAELYQDSDLALMTNATNGTGLIHLKYFVFPKNIVGIPNNPKGMFEDNKVIEEVIMLERDDTNKSGFTTIPANSFMNASNLSKVRIPEGVTTIGPSAFAGTESEPGPPLETIHFPNSLKRIENSAFAYNHALKSVTVPANVNFIGNSAFQRNDNLEDVYVLGDHVEIEDGSFNEEYTYDGFTYDNTNDGSEIISIKDWKSSKNYVKHPVRLHIPKNSDAYVYCVNPFLRALNELNDDDFNNLYTESVKTKLRAYGIDCEPYMFERNYWVEMDGHKYFKEPGAMFNEDSYLQGILKETVGYGSPKYTPFNGWHNFMFAAGDLEEKTWPDKRMIESRWYSAVFPFNLSYNQLMTAYGNGTDVREFTGVERSTNSDGKTVLKITFNDRAVVPVDHDANEDGNTYIIKGHPYMIHPGVRSVPVGEGETAVYRTIAGVSVEEANNVISTEQPLKVLGDLKEGNAIIKEDAYTFVGTYKEEGDYLPAHCYYLGMYTDRPETLGFYYTKTAGTTKKNWKQFTSIVIVSEELGDTGAKFMDMDFSIISYNVYNDDFGIATGIANTSIEQVGTSIIYNLNGQVVGKDSLQGVSKGIYIVNGKKIVVR